MKYFYYSRDNVDLMSSKIVYNLSLLLFISLHRLYFKCKEVGFFLPDIP